MNVSAKVPDDAPLMIAWKAYQETFEYKSARNWARTFIIGTTGEELGQLTATHPHLEGSLWAMFVAGWEARAGVKTTGGT